MIVIVIVLDILYVNFNITIVSLLKTKDKSIDQIHSILWSKKVKIISKQTTGAIGDLAILYRNNNNNWGIKCKANNVKKCFNFYAYSYYSQDCSYFNKQNPRIYYYKGLDRKINDEKEKS